MKKFKLLLFITLIATLIAGLSACNCNGSDSDGVKTYTVTPDTSKSLTLNVGDSDVDFTQYFILKDSDGNEIPVTADMLDLSYVDTSKTGGFMVYLNYNGSSGALWFTVKENEETPTVTYTLSVDNTKSRTLTVGDTNIDFTQYFKISASNGTTVPVTSSMLDLSKVDTSKAGTFTVTLNYDGKSVSATFTVKENGSSSETVDLSEVFSQYTNVSKWNFAVSFTDSVGVEDYYEYSGNNILNKYLDINNETWTDYFTMGTANPYYFYMDNGDGTYTKYDETTDEFDEAYKDLSLINLSQLNDLSFTKSGDYFIASNANDAGNAVIGAYVDDSGNSLTWTKLAVYIANGKVTKIEGTMSDDYIMTFEISKYGQINFTLPNATEGGGTTDPVEPTGEMMEKQTYDAETFDNRNLQDRLSQYKEPGDTSSEGNAIGLPSTGTYNALVIPVQFSGDTITQAQLDKLNKAFNGTSADTGWESVKTYYQKASYGKLNITFDVQPVCRMQYSSSYYENLTATDEQSGQDYKNGDNVILHEALAKLDSAIDFSKYDTNNDGSIDAVYLIYSAPVDYSNDSFFWAYVTWDSTDNQYDNKYAYYYMFTGLDFMDEGSANNGSMTINTETFIHETGHLLALDDYYDYDSNAGCNEGLGGCAMMDWNIGDHDAYSKIMMGWTDATVVNETQTVTIKSLQEKGDVILIPLNFDNSYFCEYLLIDLYSAQGLNELRSEHGSTVLYGGAEYGVRIYHVSSSANNPYNNNYGSFTDCNNSDTANALIKLVEADGGDSKFTDSDGYATVATESDLWKTGSTLGSVFENYTRNNGDTVNFEISIDSVSAEQATITVTFKN